MKIVEVGPRDGLQNESARIPTETKIAFVDALSATGVAEIEVSSFVSPRWVPQLADATAVVGGIVRRKGVVYSALVPNEKGLTRAMQAKVDKIAVFTAASETFNQKNINTSVAGSLRRFAPVIAAARRAGLPVRGYLSTAFWCAFEGAVSPHAVVDLVQRLVALGVEEVSISDTIGKATPDEVRRLLDLLLPRVPANRLAVHFHDTYGNGVANVLAAWSYGITTFDASVGGLGGCPYAPGASGNVSTQAVVAALEAGGARMGIDLDGLDRARALLTPYLVDERRTMPAEDAYICASCQFSTGEDCCARYSGRGPFRAPA
ncbi:MAG: hydroxymethylglutaryl-CoA lyase [Desulfosarcinaceae bacterium]